MATLDPNRAAFVQQEYRYEPAFDPNVKARNASARTVEINTNLNESDATALAAKILADNNTPRVFEVVLEGVVFLDSFIGGVPTFIANLPKFSTDGNARKVMSFTTDFEANTTTIQVRG